ncbi:MAG: hypothetical protein IK102_10335 [Treponema sp.]|nr:hypothetical protein [Treponema sp.]
MRKPFFASFFSILVGVLLCIVLSSCENFMTGSNLKEDLERYIAWANAPKVVVKIRTDSSDYGNIYPESVKVAKGDTFTVEFIQNPNTIFKYWTFTNPTTGQELGDDVVSIIEEKTTEDPVEKTTTRKLTLTLNSLPDDIEIRPKCYLQTEKIPPEFKKLNIAKNEQDAKDGTNLITFDTFVHYADNANFGGDSNKVKANIQNHHVNCLWFDLEAYDANSGVDMMEVQEQLLRNKKGTEVIKTAPYTTRYDLKPKNHDLSISKTFKHEFKIPEDGVVNIKIILNDNSGNTKIVSFDVVKDTICEMMGEWRSEDIGTFNYIADNNNLYPVSFSVYFAKTFFDNCNLYIQDLNGNEYKDSDSFLFKDIDCSISEEPISHVTAEELAQYINISEPIKQYLKIQTTYDNGTYTDYPINDIKFTFNDLNTPVNNHCDCSPIETFTFNVDNYRETNLRAIIIDDAGNERIVDTVVPKTVWITHVEVNDDNSFKLFWDISMGDSEPYIVYRSTNGTVFDYLRGTCSSGVIYDDYNNNFFNNDGTLKNGIFEFYLLKEYGIHQHIKGIKPIIIDNTTGTSSFVNLADYEIPSFTCTADAPVLSKGTRTVRINFADSFTPSNEITYLIECSGGDLSAPIYNSITDFSNTIVMEVPTSISDNEYTFNIMLTKGGKSRKDDSEAQTLLLNWDNCPPSIKDGKPLYTTIVLPDRRIIYLEKNNGIERYFDDSGLVSDDENDEYMTIKYFYSSMSDMVQRGINWSDELLVKQYKQPYSNQRLELPFDGTSGNYCYVLLKDKYGNTTNYRFDLKTTYYKVKQSVDGFNTSPEILSNEAGSAGEIRWHEKIYDAEDARWNVTSYYLNNGKWTLTEQSANSFDSRLWNMPGYESYVNNLPYLNDDDKEKIWDVKVKTGISTNDNGEDYYNYEYKLSLGGPEPNNFNKIYIWGCKPKDYYSKNIDNGYYMDVMYRYPGYAINPFTYTRKSILDGALGVSIFVDHICLVHTFYCEKDLETVQNWLSCGIEVKVEQVYNDYTYTVPLDKIPDGKYYITIVHYADGTTDKTTTKYKN